MTEVQRPNIGLAPHLVIDGAADAIEFYKKAFGAEEMMRLPGKNGRIMHASIMINGFMVMMVDENLEFGMKGPKALGGTPVTLHIGSPDVDSAMAKAEKAGATVIMPAADMFWGDRYGMVEDPFGHRWSIATPKQNLTAEEIQAAAKAQMPDYAKDGCGNV